MSMMKPKVVVASTCTASTLLPLEAQVSAPDFSRKLREAL
jgi:hypothetical protein